MKSALLALALLTPLAQADELIIHIGSYHAPSTYPYQGKQVSYNNFNPGIGYRFNCEIVAGIFYNSYKNPAAYLGYAPLWQTPISQLKLGGMLGISTGYEIPTDRPVTPIGAFMGRWEMSSTYSTQLLVVPKIWDDGATAVHLAIGVVL